MSKSVLTANHLERMIVDMKTLTIQQVADLIGVTRQTLYNMINDNRFPVKPIKGTKPRRWSPEAVNAWRVKQ